MKKHDARKVNPLGVRIFFFLLKIPLIILSAALSIKSGKKQNGTMDLYVQDPSLFDPRPPKDIPPNER